MIHLLRLVLLFGQVLGALLLRLGSSGALKLRCVAFAGFGNGGWFSVGLFAPDTVASVTAGGKFPGRARAPGLRFSAGASGLGAHRHPPPPNNSFKPTPHRGVNSVLYATLHAVATPLWGGLTQALGGRKAFRSWLLVAVRLSASVCIALRTGFQHVTLRPSLSGALTHCMRRACRLRQRWLACGRFFAPDAVASVTAGGKFAGRARASQLRFSASSSKLHPRRHPARLTSRSSRPHIVASTACFTLRCTLLPPRRGSA